MNNKRKITLPQVKMLYNTMRSAYLNSESMMVDNAFEGVKYKAKQLSLLCCYDCHWFQKMFTYVRAFKTWDHVDQQKLKQLVNDEIQL